MRRWGQIAEAKPDEWYRKTAESVYRPDLYLKAAKALVKEGNLSVKDLPQTDGYKPEDNGFIDGIVFDGRKPNDYLRKFPLGRKD